MPAPGLDLDLELVPGELAVCRLGAAEPVPDWAVMGGEEGLLAVTRTAEELSIVCGADLVPAGVEVSGPWRALRVAGTLAHSLTGVLSSLSVPLAEASIPIFVLSTFDTDYVLVPAGRVAAAKDALAA